MELLSTCWLLAAVDDHCEASLSHSWPANSEHYQLSFKFCCYIQLIKIVNDPEVKTLEHEGPSIEVKEVVLDIFFFKKKSNMEKEERYSKLWCKKQLITAVLLKLQDKWY